MLTGGLQKLTTLDFPGVVSSIVFTKGCNFRCPYCHNPELVALGFYLKNAGAGTPPAQSDLTPPAASAGNEPSASTIERTETPRPSESLTTLEPRAEMKELFRFLHKRRGLIDGLVVSGGEPCLQPDLPDFCREVRKLGYKIKLDTNGSRPKMLERLLAESLLDYVAMDLKTLPEAHVDSGICAEPDIGAKLLLSIEMLQYGVPHEFRSTCAAPFISEDNIEALARLVGPASPWFFQKAKLENVLAPEVAMIALPEQDMETLVTAARKIAPLAAVRR